MREIIVILDNRPGALAEMAELLGSEGVNILDLDVEASVERGAASLTVDRYEEALAALRRAGFRAVSAEALVVRVHDEPGALAKLAKRLAGAEINMRSLRLLSRGEEYSLVAIVCEHQDQARELLADVLVSGTT